MADIHIPSHATIDRLNEILVGWYRAKAQERPTEIAEVESRIGVHRTNISRQTAFLADAGFLRKESTGILLTPLGAQYAKYIDFGQLDEAKSTLRQIFREWEGFQPLFDYIDLQGPLAKGDLRDRIALAAERKPTGGSKTGMDALISLLRFADILQEAEGGLTLNRNALKGVGRGPEPAPQGPERIRDEYLPRAPAISPAFPAHVDISVNINGDSDPSKVKELLKAIRDVLSGEEEE